jgi:hypothetical protein
MGIQPNTRSVGLEELRFILDRLAGRNWLLTSEPAQIRRPLLAAWHHSPDGPLPKLLDQVGQRLYVPWGNRRGLEVARLAELGLLRRAEEAEAARTAPGAP